MGAACKYGVDVGAYTYTASPACEDKGTHAWFQPIYPDSNSNLLKQGLCSLLLGVQRISGEPQGMLWRSHAESIVSFLCCSSGHSLLLSEDAGLSSVGYTLSKKSLSSTAWMPLLYQSNKKAYF